MWYEFMISMQIHDQIVLFFISEVDTEHIFEELLTPYGPFRVLVKQNFNPTENKDSKSSKI